jgi:hypothetical protein
MPIEQQGLAKGETSYMILHDLSEALPICACFGQEPDCQTDIIGVEDAAAEW